MAVTIGQFGRAIRATTADDTSFVAGAVYDDVARLHAASVAIIDRYAMAAPESIKDQALVHLGQYLYDAPPAQRRATTNALRESGASAMLAPYRSHRLGIEAVTAVAAAAGVDRDAVIAIIRELVSDWAFVGSRSTIPVERPATQINEVEYGIPAASSQSITVQNAGERVFSDIRIFSGTTPDADTSTSRQSAGIRIDETGIYSVELQLSLELTSSAAGDWGVSLIRSNGLSGNDEVIHDSSIFSAHTDALTGADEDFIQTVHLATQEMDQGDVIYASISFGSSEAQSRVMNYNISPSPTESFIRVRKFVGVIGGVPIGSGLDQGAVDNRIGTLVWDWAQSGDNGPIDTPGKITEAVVFSLVKNILLEGQGIDITDVDATNRITIAATGAVPGSGGLTQAQVDARINALIPANRRQIDPSGFTASDDGTFAVWDDANSDWENGSFKDENGFEWTFDTSEHVWSLNSNKLDEPAVDARIAARPDKGLQQAAVDARITSIVPSWALMATRFNDEQRELFDAFTGDAWIDFASAEVRNKVYTTEASARSDDLVGAVWSATYAAGARRENVFLVARVPADDISVPQINEQLRLAIGDFGTVAAKYFTTRRIAGSSYYIVSFDLADWPAADVVKVERFNPITVDFSKFSNLYQTESWARLGNPDPIPPSKVNVLNQYVTERMDTEVGIALASTAAVRRSVAAEFTETLTIGDNQHGLLLVGIRWFVPESSQAQLSLGETDLTIERNIAFHEIAALDDYSASTTNGIKIGTVDVHATNINVRGAKVGEATFYIGHNADGDVLYFFDYQPDADYTGTAKAGSIQVRAEIYSLPSGAPPAQSAGPSGGGDTFTLIFEESDFTFCTGSQTQTRKSYAVGSANRVAIEAAFADTSTKAIYFDYRERATAVGSLQNIMAGSRVEYLEKENSSPAILFPAMWLDLFEGYVVRFQVDGFSVYEASGTTNGARGRFRFYKVT